jgi:hypothetical protein
MFFQIIFHHFPSFSIIFHHFPSFLPSLSICFSRFLFLVTTLEAVSGFVLPQVQVRQQRAMSAAANHAQLAPGAPRAPNQTFGYIWRV